MEQKITLRRFTVLGIPFRVSFSDAAKQLKPSFVIHIPPVSFTAVHAGFLDPALKYIFG